MLAKQTNQDQFSASKCFLLIILLMAMDRQPVTELSYRCLEILLIYAEAPQTTGYDAFLTEAALNQLRDQIVVHTDVPFWFERRRFRAIPEQTSY